MLPWQAGKMRAEDIDHELLPRRAALNRWRINGENVALIYERGLVAEIFGGAIIVKQAVTLPFHIVQLGVNVGGELAVAAQFVGQKLEAPARIHVTVKRADA